MPISIRANAALHNDTDASEIEVAGTTTTVARPFLNDYTLSLSGTVGLPQANDLSVGLSLYTFGADDGFKSKTAGATTELVDKSQTLSLTVPFGMKLGSLYNYGYVRMTRKSKAYDDGTGGLADYDKSAFTLGAYDKIRMPSILKGGSESAVWASFNTPDRSSFTGEVFTTNFGAGISNRFDIKPAESVTLALNPKFYATLAMQNDNANDTSTTTLSNNLASDMGISAKLGNSPFTLYAGAQPILSFTYTAYEDSTSGASEKRAGGGLDLNCATSAIVCIGAELGGGVTANFTITNASTFALECVIPLPPAATPAKSAALVPAQPAPKAAAAPAKTTAKPARQ